MAKRGWQPEQLAKRAVQLADLVEYVPLFTVGWAVRRVLARLVPLHPRPDAGDEQGAALSMARREMATLYPE